MIVTAFLGLLTIAQNELYTTKQQSQQQKQQDNSVTYDRPSDERQ